MAVQKKLIGRIPTYKGDWSDGVEVKEKFRFTYKGSEFQAMADDLITPPLNNNDELNDGWKIISWGTDAYKVSEQVAENTTKLAELENKIGKSVITNADETVKDIESFPNRLYIYIKSDEANVASIAFRVNNAWIQANKVRPKNKLFLLEVPDDTTIIRFATTDTCSGDVVFSYFNDAALTEYLMSLEEKGSKNADNIATAFDKIGELDAIVLRGSSSAEKSYDFSDATAGYWESANVLKQYRTFMQTEIDVANFDKTIKGAFGTGKTINTMSGYCWVINDDGTSIDLRSLGNGIIQDGVQTYTLPSNAKLLRVTWDSDPTKDITPTLLFKEVILPLVSSVDKLVQDNKENKDNIEELKNDNSSNKDNISKLQTDVASLKDKEILELECNVSVSKPYDFNGKQLLCVGDSIMYGTYTSEDPKAKTENNLPDLFAKRTGAIVYRGTLSDGTTQDTAIPGAVICKTVSGEAGVLEDELKRRIANSQLRYIDVVLIHAGTNDWGKGKNLDEVEQAIRNIFGFFAEKKEAGIMKADARVIWILPINCNERATVNPTYRLNDIRKLIANVVLEYGYEYVNGAMMGFPTQNNTLSNVVMADDGIHPSEVGYKMYERSFSQYVL